MENTVLTVRGVPVELARHAKAEAAMQGISLQEFVVRAIQEKLHGRGRQAKGARNDK